MKIVGLVMILVYTLFGSVYDDFMSDLKIEAKKENPNFSGFDAKRGESIFLTEHVGKKGEKISCVSCHGTNFRISSKNHFTGKAIEPLSPKANPERLSEAKKIEKWLRRNFNDVYNREGSAQEKGDVLLYIYTKD